MNQNEREEEKYLLYKRHDAKKLSIPLSMNKKNSCLSHTNKHKLNLLLATFAIYFERKVLVIYFLRRKKICSSVLTG